MTIEQYLAEVERYQTAIALLVAAVFIAIGYILTLPVPEPRSKVEPDCPLHKRPRSTCPPESH